VRVVGTVDTFDRVGLSDELGITLSEEPFGAWDDRPFMLADQIDTVFEPSTIPPDEPSVPAGDQ